MPDGVGEYAIASLVKTLARDKSAIRCRSP